MVQILLSRIDFLIKKEIGYSWLLNCYVMHLILILMVKFGSNCDHWHMASQNHSGILLILWKFMVYLILSNAATKIYLWIYYFKTNISFSYFLWPSNFCISGHGNFLPNTIINLESHHNEQAWSTKPPNQLNKETLLNLRLHQDMYDIKTNERYVMSQDS